MTLCVSQKTVDRITRSCEDKPILQEASSLLFTFIPHDGNHATRKIVAILLVVGWMLMLAGVLSGYLILTMATVVYFQAFTAIVFAVIGRLWGISYKDLYEKVSK